MAMWDIEKSKTVYNMGHWDDGYFDINSAGHLIAKPIPNRPDSSIDLVEATRQIKQCKLNLPVLVRFTDILKNRVDCLCKAFYQAQSHYRYKGS